MKKVLLGTSALALIGAFSTQASANEWNVKVGGYMEQFVAYSDSDAETFPTGEFGGVDSKQDAEIIFTPSLTLDNGLKFGVNVQLEALTDSDQIDEAFLFVEGSFGRVVLGSENSAGYTMTYAAPDVTFLNVNSGSTTAFVPYSGGFVDANGDGDFADVGDIGTGADIFRGTLGSTYLENGRNNDAQRFTYFTPRFAGFQLGASYARDGNQDSNAQVDLDGNTLNNIFDVGANYVNSFGDFDVAISGRYGIASNDGANQENPEIWSAGINLGYAGVTIGGSFAEQNDSNNSTDDGTAWDAGIAYETGPWGFSVTYFTGENVDEDGGNEFLGADETLDQYLIGVNYDLAKGVSLNAFGAYVDFEEDLGNDGVGDPGDDVDGFIVGTGIKVTF